MTTPPRTNADAAGRAADGGARQPGAARAATDLVTSIERLREIVGEPTARSRDKERPRLHALDRAWLAASPLCFIATADARGNCDVSPKGDPPGFVHVPDEATIVIPDRPGNKRVDGFANILANPRVGLIFLVPGRPQTLRVNGAAELVADAPYFDELMVKGHRPQLALVVHIHTVFFHCAKAFLRSNTWQPPTWSPDVLPSHATIVKAVEGLDESMEDLEAHYGPAYLDLLYAEPAPAS